MIITLLIIHAFVTLVMIGLILLQKSDGSGPLGIGGGNNALFTARGVANILTRATAVLASLFIGNCILIGILTNREINERSFLFSQPAKTAPKTADGGKSPLETSEPATGKAEPVTSQETAKAETLPNETSKTEKAKTLPNETSKTEKLPDDASTAKSQTSELVDEAPSSSKIQETKNKAQPPVPIEKRVQKKGKGKLKTPTP